MRIDRSRSRSLGRSLSLGTECGHNTTKRHIAASILYTYPTADIKQHNVIAVWNIDGFCWDNDGVALVGTRHGNGAGRTLMVDRCRQEIVGNGGEGIGETAFGNVFDQGVG